VKKSLLKNYANLIAKMGVNVQKGQEVVIYCDLDQPEFVKLLVEECYKAGAKKVIVEWSYQPLDKLHYRYRSLKTLSSYEDWELEKLNHMTKVFPCRIFLLSSDPDGLKGINQHKMAVSRQRRYPIYKPYRDAIENKHQWCIAAVPGIAWAKKLFPDCTKKQAVEKLWEAILSTSRVEENPIEAWNKHNDFIHEKCNYLNSLEIAKLHYTAGNGTDFSIGMIPQARFLGASEKTLQGVEYNPNIPSEECFISPLKNSAQGIVYSSKPLSYEGQLIENFWIRFKDGVAIAWKAEKNDELLTKLINMDEGSARLGECALVPYDSPIQKSGILFYNTLFDENAACHLALGVGFPETIKDFEKYSLDEIHELGVNDSMVHEDFMIGTKDLNIEAECRDGRKLMIFKNGNWAI